jgi:hypothetical protein
MLIFKYWNNYSSVLYRYHCYDVCIYINFNVNFVNVNLTIIIIIIIIGKCKFKQELT